ncbi:MAG: thioredoxin-related protein [Marinoscillum sp.]|jgi:thioredoxin-related protein
MIKPFLSVCFIFITTFISLAQDGINFEKLEWGEALQKAKESNQLVFLEGYTNWSQPCAILEKYTFSDKEVAGFYNHNFINVRIDMEDIPGFLIAEEYLVSSFPVLLFLDGEGQVIHRGCGAIASDELIALGKTALGNDHLAAMDSVFNAGERSSVFIVKYSEALNSACLDPSELVETYFASLPHKEWTNNTSWDMINLNVSDPFSEPFQYLMSYQDMYALKYGKDTVDQKIYNVLLDQIIAIYEGEDLTYLATRAIERLISFTDFNGKEELLSLTRLKTADLKENWPVYAQNAIKVVKEQEVTDPDQLNEFAWKFYLFVDDKSHLELAAGWMKQVLEGYPNATYYDSYASLLFKLGRTKEAIKSSEKALQAAVIEFEDLMHFESQLEKFSKE